MSKAPRVTVLMSVYNGAEYLHEAIDSILAQSFTDFEFLIIDDGSKDDSLKIIKSYGDPRIRCISRSNKGLVASLNEGIEKARGEYIARQDADDLSLPDRLEKEVAYLDAHPNVALVGSNYIIIDDQGKRLDQTNVFTNPKDLKTAIISCNQYGHGSIMMRRSALERVGVYDKSVGHVEDYDLWVRLSQMADIANFEEPLYLYRKNMGGITRQNLELQIKQTLAIRDKAFEYFLKHRRQFKLFTMNPSGERYRDRKAILFRDFAYMYRSRRKYIRGYIMLIAATLIQPRNKRNYKFLLLSLRRPKTFQWEYEWL